MRDDLKEAVIDAARDYLLGCGGTGRLRHALIAYETAALDEAGMPMLAAGMVRADGLPPLTEMQQAEPFHECLSDAVNGGLSVMRIAPSDAGAAPVAAQADMRECRHCGWMCAPNDAKSKRWYPLAEPVAAQASEPVCNLWVDPVTKRYEVDHCTHPSNELIPVFAAPQPSAAAVRDAALEEAESICDKQEYFWTDCANEERADTLTYRLCGAKADQSAVIRDRIRALKSAPPQPAELPGDEINDEIDDLFDRSGWVPAEQPSASAQQAEAEAWDAALEAAAERLSQAHSWLTNVAAARLVLSLKGVPVAAQVSEPVVLEDIEQQRGR